MINLNRLLLYASLCGLALAMQAKAQYTYGNCTQTGSLGGGWTVVGCLPYQNASGTPTTLSYALQWTSSIGDLLVVNTAQSGDGVRTLAIADSQNNVATGTVNTSGATVTWVSGLPFSVNGCTPTYAVGTCQWNGETININGTSYTISTVNSLTSITLTTSAGTQTGVSYSGPGWWCSDTYYDQESAATSVCAAVEATSGTDTITLTAAGTGASGQYTLEWGATEFSNASGFGSLDTGACLWAGNATQGSNSIFTQCSPTYGYPQTNGQQTVGSNPATATQTVSLTNPGELVFISYSCGVGPVGPTSGWDGLVIGVLTASSSNGYCDNGNGYCANEPQSEAQYASSSGSFSAVVDDGDSGDYYMMQVLAFTAGTESKTMLPIVASLGGTVH